MGLSADTGELATSRRRRNEVTTEIRKDKREQVVAKRRNIEIEQPANAQAEFNRISHQVRVCSLLCTVVCFGGFALRLLVLEECIDRESAAGSAQGIVRSNDIG